MNIGIPNEVAVDERRIALTPVGVYALINEGHTVFVESGAGESCGFSDEEFREVGAEIVFSNQEAFKRADLVVKVQPPTEEESVLFETGKVVFSFLNLGMARRPVIERLLERKVTALGYEFAEAPPDGRLTILTAMSEIAGVLLPQIAGRYLESTSGGRGITLTGVAGIPPANVVILGAGVVGVNAARSFSALGAQVLVLDRDVQKLRELDHSLNKRVATSIVTPLLVERAVRFADVLVGAVLVRGHKTPHLVPVELVQEMKPGSVILDVSIDQGGCVATSRPTRLSSPTFVQHGVTHYCVPNITAMVARTAAHALNNSVLPWLLQVAKLGMPKAVQRFQCLRSGTYLADGRSTLKALSDLFDLDYEALEQD